MPKSVFVGPTQGPCTFQNTTCTLSNFEISKERKTTSYLNPGLVALGRGLADGERRGRGGRPAAAPLRAAAPVGQALVAATATGPQSIPVR